MPALNLSLGTVMGIAGAACLLLAVVRVLTGPVNPVVLLLLLPVYVCSVSVISYLAGDSMYYFERWRREFVPYDSKSHPIRALLFFLFLAAGDVFFVVVFFRLQSGAA